MGHHIGLEHPNSFVRSEETLMSHILLKFQYKNIRFKTLNIGARMMRAR